jgi:GntR family phosphonate transport system transcriptional regulator
LHVPVRHCKRSIDEISVKSLTLQADSSGARENPDRMGEATDLSRGVGIALWRQIAEALEKEIRGGARGPGERLPTEAELAERFGVNRHTVRRAVAALQERGLVTVSQGRGTFVPGQTIEYAIGRRTRFQQNIERLGRTASGELLSVETIPAPDVVAAELCLARGAAIHVVERLGRVDGVAVSLATHHFPAARFPDLAAHFRTARAVTAALRLSGLDDYVRRSTRIGARPADAREQRLLDLPRNRPVIVTEAINVDAAGEIVEYGVARIAADRVQIVVEGADRTET